MTAVGEKVIRWRAGADRVGHAFRSSSRGARTLCGLPVVEERFAWPADARCRKCEASL